MTIGTESKTNNEAGLIERIKNGEREAFELLFRRYYHRLVGFANNFTGNIADSEEIVQEVFYKIWKNREMLHINTSSKPYLFSSVKHLCLNFLDHKKVADKYLEIVSLVYQNDYANDYGAYEEMVLSELDAKVRKEIEELPEECRRIFTLSRYENQKYSEIAEKLGISVKTVETQIGRALRKLREGLKDYLTIGLLLVLTGVGPG